MKYTKLGSHLCVVAEDAMVAAVHDRLPNMNYHGVSSLEWTVDAAVRRETPRWMDLPSDPCVRLIADVPRGTATWRWHPQIETQITERW